MRTLLSEIEQSIAAKLCTARFPAYSASKRFARDLGDGYVRELSDKGRKFMAYIVHRFRRQYTLTQEEQAWVDDWLNKQTEPTIRKAVVPSTKSPPAAEQTEQRLLEFT